MNDSVINIVFKKLVLEIAPTRFRRWFFFTVMEAAVLPLQQMLEEFKTNRKRNIYRINMNGQVCHLRGLLNDAFDITERRIRISAGTANDWVMFHCADYSQEIEETGNFVININAAVLLPKASAEASDVFGNKVLTINNAVMFSKMGDVGAVGFDFIIEIPTALFASIDLDRLKALINEFKLASKRYAIKQY